MFIIYVSSLYYIQYSTIDESIVKQRFYLSNEEVSSRTAATRKGSTLLIDKFHSQGT